MEESQSLIITTDPPKPTPPPSTLDLVKPFKLSQDRFKQDQKRKKINSEALVQNLSKMINSVLRENEIKSQLEFVGRQDLEGSQSKLRKAQEQ